jgi:hypothetical protein
MLVEVAGLPFLYRSRLGPGIGSFPGPVLEPVFGRVSERSRRHDDCRCYQSQMKHLGCDRILAEIRAKLFAWLEMDVTGSDQHGEWEGDQGIPCEYLALTIKTLTTLKKTLAILIEKLQSFEHLVVPPRRGLNANLAQFISGGGLPNSLRKCRREDPQPDEI